MRIMLNSRATYFDSYCTTSTHVHILYSASQIARHTIKFYYYSYIILIINSIPLLVMWGSLNYFCTGPYDYQQYRGILWVPLAFYYSVHTDRSSQASLIAMHCRWVVFPFGIVIIYRPYTLCTVLTVPVSPTWHLSYAHLRRCKWQQNWENAPFFSNTV
jgi:hypothetical protein